MSCLPRDIREEKQERGLVGCLTDGKTLNEFNLMHQFHGQNVDLTQNFSSDFIREVFIIMH